MRLITPDTYGGLERLSLITLGLVELYKEINLTWYVKQLCSKNNGFYFSREHSTFSYYTYCVDPVILSILIFETVFQYIINPLTAI